MLKSKGCPGATTVHQLVYFNKELPDGTFVHIPRVSPENPKLKLVVVDEVSMLTAEQWNILLGWKVHILCLGDPGQLPAIEQGTDVLDHPHVFLDEIMRQAQDNEIIRLSMDVREGKPLSYFKGKDVRIVPKSSIGDNLLLTADQIICGRNTTRYDLNRRVRQAIWKDKFSEAPLNGEKCICLKNYWQLGDLTNGTTGIIDNIYTRDTHLFKPQMFCDFHADTGDDFYYLHTDYKIFTEGKPTINQDNFREFPKHERPMEFDFGYAITCHKSQGSQYDKVVLFNEWIGNRDTYQRWLYTGITRSVSKLVIAL